MRKMLNFDSFTLVPTYSDIYSRGEVDVSSTINGVRSSLPIINANMLSLCTPCMISRLYNHNTFSSYHRFFNSLDDRKQTIVSIIENNIEKSNILKTDLELDSFFQRFYVSLGTKMSEECDFVDWLYINGIKNVIIDVNHGHHVMVKDMIRFIKDNYIDMNVMAGNVCSVDGISYLSDCGADIIKVGNSFGFSCSTIKASGFGISSIHAAKEYREKTGNWDTNLCMDGGIREVADIAKALIWGNVVMIGKLFAGCDESFGNNKIVNGEMFKEYYGNASFQCKKIINQDHVKNIEGVTKLVPYVGCIDDVLKSIKEGLQSAFSFVGARNLSEYQSKTINQILMV